MDTLTGAGPTANIKITKRHSMLMEPRRKSDITRTAQYATTVGTLSGYTVHRLSDLENHLQSGDILLVSS